MKGVKPSLLHLPFDLRRSYTSKPQAEELELERLALRRNGKLRLALQSIDECKKIIKKKLEHIEKLKKEREITDEIFTRQKEDSENDVESKEASEAVLTNHVNSFQDDAKAKDNESETDIEEEIADYESEVFSENEFEIIDVHNGYRESFEASDKNKNRVVTEKVKENKNRNGEDSSASRELGRDSVFNINGEKTGTETINNLESHDHDENEKVKDTLSARTELHDKVEKYCLEINREMHEGFLDMFVKHCLPEERIVLGNKLCRSRLLETLVDFYKEVAELTTIKALTDYDLWTLEDTGDGVRFLLTVRQLFCEFSTCCARVASCLSETNFPALLVKDLRTILEQGFEKFESHVSADRNHFIVCSAMTLLYNCARHPYVNREKLKHLRLVDVLKPFLKTENIHVEMMTLLVLVYIAEEKEMDAILDPEYVFDFLLERINEALLSKDRLEYEHHIAQFVNAITTSVYHHARKKLFMNKHPLTLMLLQLNGPDQCEILATLKLVLELAFLQENRKTLQNNSELIEIVKELQQHDNDEIRTAACRAMFVICGYEQSGKRNPDEFSKEQVMLSYSLGDQEHILQIYHTLKEAGISVWIDVVELNKYSNILDATALAVRQSSLILVCFSEFYKHDSACRLEAEYAFKLKKLIVPVQVHEGYEPVDWLMNIIGPRFYLSFPPDNRFDKHMYRLQECLIKNKAGITDYSIYSSNITDERISPGPSRAFCRGPSTLSRGPTSLLLRGPSRVFSTAPSRAVSRGPSRAPTRFPVYEKKVKDWDRDDVIFWASQFKLEGKAWRTVSKLSVQQILYIYSVWHKTPEKFYSWAESVIKLGSIEDLMRFRNAVKSLSEYV